MKDDRGLYYYPFPGTQKVRMYVRRTEGEVCFRLWNSDDPWLWTEHGWVPHGAIKQAASMYDGKNFDPGAYDIDLADTLLKENESE